MNHENDEETGSIRNEYKNIPVPEMEKKTLFLLRHRLSVCVMADREDQAQSIYCVKNAMES